MFAADGIVVTEIRTPVSAPDFAVVSDNIPAIPAQKAIRNEKKSGLEMMSASEWLADENSSGVRSVHLKMSETTYVTAIPNGNPTTSASSERSASRERRWTAATQAALIGPNS